MAGTRSLRPWSSLPTVAFSTTGAAIRRHRDATAYARRLNTLCLRRRHRRNEANGGRPRSFAPSFDLYRRATNGSDLLLLSLVYRQVFRRFNTNQPHLVSPGSGEGTNQKVTKDSIVSIELLGQALGEIAISGELKALLGNAKNPMRSTPPESNCWCAVIDRQPATHDKALAD